MHDLYPSTGYITVDVPITIIKNGVTTETFKHHWADSPEMAVRKALELDKKGKTVFISQASFKDTKSRKAANALEVKNFFLDIDCGADPKYVYKTQAEGLAGLQRFCRVTGLPTPTVVNSGNGLYAHWILTHSLPSELWLNAAKMLQKLVKTLEPGLDLDSISTDRSRILRPAGATHRKDLDNLKTVKAGPKAPLVDPDDFVRLLKEASSEAEIPLAAPKRESKIDMAVFTAGLDDHRPSSAEEIALKCLQIASLKAKLGDVAEPLWYAGIGLLRFTLEAPEIVHTWSAGHAEYSREGTDKKVLQLEKVGTGPTTCAKFNTDNPGVCSGCKFAGKLTSPITLGYAAPTALAKTEESSYPDPPFGFLLTEDGVYYDDGGTPISIYPYPVYVSAVNADNGGESFTLKHRMPHDGWREATLQSKCCTDHKVLFSELINRHVHVLGKDAKGLFALYVELSMMKLRKAGKLARLYGQMGWTKDVEGDDLLFVHGPSVYRKDAEPQTVGYSATAPDFVKSLEIVGDHSEWVKNTSILNRPGLEGLAFEFLCTSFGAPLVRFTGYDGAMLAVTSARSGVGKTLVGMWGVSAWGDPKTLVLLQKDTENALVGRLGVYNTLPVYIDEVTNITPDALSDLAYKVTQGRDKARMTQKAVEKANINRWNTLAVVSSNQSLINKLSALKGDAGAEINRIFEYEVENGFTDKEGSRIFEGFASCYGGVGREYGSWLVSNQDQHGAVLSGLTSRLKALTDALPEERYWVMVAAVGIYGGQIARQLGLSLIETEPIMDWLVGTIKGMRAGRDGQAFDSVNFIGAMLDRHAQGILVLRDYDAKSKFIQAAVREPRSQLIGRIEEDKNHLWISADHIKKELHKINISPIRCSKDLKEKGLMAVGEKINLGRGSMFSGSQQSCWKFNLADPALAGRILRLVKTEETMTKEKVI